MVLGKIGKNLGKAVLTVVSPPFGFMSFAKSKGGKAAAFLGGALLSFCASTVYITRNIEILFDMPETYKTKTFSRKTIPIVIPGFFLSPLSISYMSRDATITKDPTVVGSKKYFGIEGEAIEFNGKKYILKFPQDRNFGISTGGAFDFINLEKARTKMENEKGKLENLLTAGDLLEAKKSANKLKNLRAEFYETEKAYEEMKKVFEKVVDKMNFEYGRIKQKLEQELERDQINKINYLVE